MSQENVELVRRMAEAFARGDLDAALAGLHPQVEMRATGRLPDVEQAVRGREAVRRWLGDLSSAFDEVRFEPERYLDAGDAVVVPTRQTMRGKDSGVAVVNRVIVVWHLSDGLVTLVESYADEREALEAVGLSV
jgi:ketosteroid isomerase-like protein